MVRARYRGPRGCGCEGNYTVRGSQQHRSLPILPSLVQTSVSLWSPAVARTLSPTSGGSVTTAETGGRESRPITHEHVHDQFTEEPDVLRKSGRHQQVEYAKVEAVGLTRIASLEIDIAESAKLYATSSFRSL